MEIITLPESRLSFGITNTIRELEGDWKLPTPIPIMLSLDYLLAFERCKPDGMSLLFGYCKKDGKTLALFHLQIIGFDAERRLRLQMETGQASSLSDRLALAIKLFVARKVNLKGAILGNLMTAGPFGIVFDSSLTSDDESYIISELGNQILGKFNSYLDCSIAVIKDITPQKRLKIKHCRSGVKLHEFTIQPSMRLVIRPHWTTFEKYMEDLESKYRTKLKKVIGHSKSFKIVDATSEILTENLDKIYSLYLEVAQSAGFNLVDLKKEYLLEIKKQLDKKFIVKLVYLNDEIIAFYTYFPDQFCLNAHFIGYKKVLNKKYDLYHNLLIFYLKDAIELKEKAIEFARTALEIKSSLGAEPIDYYCYIAHESKFVNRLVPGILELLKPVEVWQPRSPFK